MSTILDSGKTDSWPPAPSWRDRVLPWARFPRAVAGFALVIGAVHWWYGNQRLHHTDLWGHLAYGRWIATTRSLPAMEPLMPLAQGVPFVDAAWLTQLVGYCVFSRYGTAGIQFLHASAVTICLSLLAWGCFRRTRSFSFTLVSLALFEALNWYQLQIVRPQLAGLVCFGAVVALLSSRRVCWLAIPVTLAFWANLHGSFIVGIGLVACATVGRGIDVWWRTGRPTACIRDARARRLLLTTALSAVAVLINPYGPRLYAEVLSFSSNPNLQSLIEWEPLDFRTVQGRLALGSALALVFIYWLSPRRVSAGEALALVALGAAALWAARFLVWWSPLAAACSAIHGHAAWRRFHPKPLSMAPLLRTRASAAMTLSVGCISVAMTPLGLQVLWGMPAEFKKSVSLETPVDAAEWLKKHPPTGQIFNNYEWGDYLMWAGPEELKVFVASHVHLVPRTVWRDYLTVMDLGPGWHDLFDRYGINTIVLDRTDLAPTDQSVLISKLDRDSGWERTYEDRLAVIFRRNGQPHARE